MKKSRYLLIGIIIVALAFCSLSCKEAEKENWSNYFPLEMGNQWVYTAQVIRESNPKENMEFAFMITGKETINNINCFIYEGIIDGISFQKEFYQITEEGLIAHKRTMKSQHKGNVTVNLDPPEPMLLFPISAGKNWSWKGKTLGNDIQDFDFKIAGEENVTVPAGDFKAYRLEIYGKLPNSKNKTLISTRWFSKGVGMIKEETKTDKVYVLASLKQYTVAGKTVPDGAKPLSAPMQISDIEK